MSSQQLRQSRLAESDSSEVPFGAHRLEDQFEFLQKNLNMVRAPDLRIATLASCVFLHDGLQAGQRVALASFQNPDILFSTVNNYGFDFSGPLLEERFVYLYYKPDLPRLLSLSQDYLALRDEIVTLCDGQVDRLVLLNVEALLNLHSDQLAYSSLEKLLWVAGKLPGTALSVFAAGDGPLKRLDSACRALLPRYVDLVE